MSNSSPVQLSALKKEDIKENLYQRSGYHLNITQIVIMTTEDKVRLCLNEHAEKLAIRKTWAAPVALFVTIVLAILTADFKDFLSIPKATWHALFIISAVITGAWAVKTIYEAIRTKTSIEHIIQELKESSQDISQD